MKKTAKKEGHNELDEKEQLYSSIQNCWTKYNSYMGGSKVTEEQNEKIRKYMNKYLSLL